jgi:hypothetical protein
MLEGYHVSLLRDEGSLAKRKAPGLSSGRLIFSPGSRRCAKTSASLLEMMEELRFLCVSRLLRDRVWSLQLSRLC